MKLWDHRTPIRWAYEDHPSTPEEMLNDPKHRHMLDAEVVLYDDGRGTVYRYAMLDELKARYDVRVSNPTGALRAVKRAMSRHVPGNSELSKSNTENRRSIESQGRDISHLQDGMDAQSREIRAQNGRISEAVGNSEASLEASEANATAIEELAVISTDSSDLSMASAEAIEEIFPQTMGNSEGIEAVSLATEDILLQMSGILDRLERIERELGIS